MGCHLKTIASSIPIDFSTPPWASLEMTELESRIVNAAKETASPLQLDLPLSRSLIAVADPASVADSASVTDCCRCHPSLTTDAVFCRRSCGCSCR
jgi:hypothetical protein